MVYPDVNCLTESIGAKQKNRKEILWVFIASIDRNSNFIFIEEIYGTLDKCGHFVLCFPKEWVILVRSSKHLTKHEQKRWGIPVPISV
jgi:hypothetical protein